MTPSRALTPEEVKEILELDRKDITATKLRSLFAGSINREPRFNTYDTFTLPAKKYFNKETIETTIGRYIFNIVCLPEKFLDREGYQNTTLSKGAISKIEEKMGAMVLEDKMSTKEYAEYLDSTEWLGMGMAYYISPTMNYEFNKSIPEVIKRRDELFEKYADDIAKGDGNRVAEIENELLDMAKKHLKDNKVDSYDFFDSGIGKFGNHYKKTSIMGGAMSNPFTKKLDIVKSNFVDGIDKSEISKYAGGTVQAGFERQESLHREIYECKIAWYAGKPLEL